ncbi:MAG: histidine phosphatase family protein [Pyrinomonadaceae bacterium]|nr:histidine phosphatase family protein [Pyrinomonadaceae bacterium]
MKKTFLISVVALTLVLIGCPSKPVDETPVAEQKPLVVFLVRHAEKVDAGKDPELSSEGKKRTEDLTEILRSADIGHVHSTDFTRTRDTAAPVAKASGVEVEKYDPRDLDGLAEKLKKAGGRHLVVGHSNTTPKLTELLGGSAGTEIDENGEYDRLYIVTIGKDGTANSVLMRFGEPFEKKEDEKKAAAGA